MLSWILNSQIVDDNLMRLQKSKIVLKECIVK